ncbi:MAG: tryptophan--tRNA ligase, partial [Promethearchaeota archaeon]
MSDKLKLDPWSSTNILEEDYIRLIEEFGIEEISDVMRLKIDNRFIRRKIIFGHRSLEDIIKAIEKKQHWAVMSG